jgi:hypothetical protein
MYCKAVVERGRDENFVERRAVHALALRYLNSRVFS